MSASNQIFSAYRVCGKGDNVTGGKIPAIPNAQHAALHSAESFRVNPAHCHGYTTFLIPITPRESRETLVNTLEIFGPEKQVFVHRPTRTPLLTLTLLAVIS